MNGLVIVGAGPIGTLAAQAALAESVVSRIVAVVDPDDGARRELVTETGAPGYASTVELPRAGGKDVALVAFASSAEKVAPEIIRLVGAGYHVVTTCEGLAWAPRPLWEAMHTSARSDHRSIVVTGTNPGFVMDRLPLMVAGASRAVTGIHVQRRFDISSRRPSLIAKSGYGLSREEFSNGVAAGRVGVPGLAASAKLVARGLEWPPKNVTVDIAPIVEHERIIGASHTARLSAGEGRTIVLELDMAWGLMDPVDRITIDGTPPITVETVGGYSGDEGTVSQVLNAVRRVESLEPGFYRPTDLPLRFGVS